MLRIRRLTQLLIALCCSAFLAALVSLVLYQILALVALPESGAAFANDIRGIEDIDKLKEITIRLLSAAFDLRDRGITSVMWGLGFVLIWSSVLGAVSIAIYRQIRNVSETHNYQAPEVENFIDQALAGKLELWKIFWGGYVTLTLVLFTVSGGILKLLTHIGTDSTPSFLFFVLTAPIALSIPMTIYLLCAVLVWQSASNTSSVGWCYSAKIVILICTIVPVITSVYSTSTIILSHG